MTTRFSIGWGRALVAPALLLALSLTNCGTGTCLVRVCEPGGKNCRCQWHTCPKGSFYDIETEQCRCHPGYIQLQGSCFTQLQANRYCGQGFEYKNDKCVPTCDEGEQFDLKTSTCVTRTQIGEIADLMGIPLGENQTLGCKQGERFVIEDARAGIGSCVPVENSCPRDTYWNGNMCVNSPKCAIGEVFDHTTKKCTTVATSKPNESNAPSNTKEQQHVFDLQKWTWINYGMPGGEGSPQFCSGFNKKPTTFAVRPGSSISVLVTVNVTAPANDPKQARVSTSSFVQQTKQPVTGQGANLIDDAAQKVLIPLQIQSGSTSQEAVQTTVSCRIVNASRPAPVPESGGL